MMIADCAFQANNKFTLILLEVATINFNKPLSYVMDPVGLKLDLFELILRTASHFHLRRLCAVCKPFILFLSSDER